MSFRITNADQANWLPLIIVLPGTFITFLNVSLLNVALPELMTYFQVSSLQIQWLVTAFTATLGVVMPVTGYLISVKGSKTVYCWSLLLFLIGSCFAPFSHSLSWLIISRIVQAVGAGLMGPVSMTIIYWTIPLKKRGVAMGILGLASMAAPAVGPVVGGYLLKHLTWPYLFILNLPIVLPALWLARKYLPQNKPKSELAFDFVGFVSLTIALLIILWSVNSLGNGLASSTPWLGGLLVLALFIVHELKVPHPLLELHLLKYRNFLVGNIVAGVINFGLFAGVILIPLYTQEVLGYTPFETGLVMGPAALVLALSQPLGGWLLDKLDARLPIASGLILVVVSTWYLSKITASTDYHYLLQWQLVRGVGLGLSFAVVTAALNAVPDDKTAQGTALLNTLRQLSGALGALAITVFLNWSLSKHIAPLQEFNLGQAKALASGNAFLLICLLTTFTLPIALFLVNTKLPADNLGEPSSLNFRKGSNYP